MHFRLMSMDERARPVGADSLQADYFRHALNFEREECSATLKEHARTLTDCMESG